MPLDINLENFNGFVDTESEAVSAEVNGEPTKSELSMSLSSRKNAGGDHKP